MKRPAQPAELAPAFVFLASNESSHVNGEVAPTRKPPRGLVWDERVEKGTCHFSARPALAGKRVATLFVAFVLGLVGAVMVAAVPVFGGLQILLAVSLAFFAVRRDASYEITLGANGLLVAGRTLVDRLDDLQRFDIVLAEASAGGRRTFVCAVLRDDESIVMTLEPLDPVMLRFVGERLNAGLETLEGLRPYRDRAR